MNTCEACIEFRENVKKTTENFKGTIACHSCYLQFKRFCKGCERSGDRNNCFEKETGICYSCEDELEKMFECTNCSQLNSVQLGRTCSVHFKEKLRYCFGCDQIGNAKACFEGSNKDKRNKCKNCRKEDKEENDRRNYEKRKYEQQPLIRYCNTCENELPIENFERISASYRNECEPCRIGTRYKQSTTGKELREIAKNHYKVCIHCNESKEISSNFPVNGRVFKNICKNCYNLNEYYKEYRLRERTKDEKGFIEHNTKVHQKWVMNNLERHKEYMKEYGQSIDGKISRYITKGKERNLIIDEEKTRELFRTLLQIECLYCGVNENNGIDRINSNLPYSEENCVPCCTACNLIKNSMDAASFLQKVRQIVIYHKKVIKLPEQFYKPLNFYNSKKLTGKSGNYNAYIDSAIKRNIKFELTEEEFKRITRSICYLCGEKGENGSTGVDRVDNNVGYIKENCMPCCRYCNIMKNKYSYIDFLNFCVSITTFSTNVFHMNLCSMSSFNGIMTTTRTKI